MELSKIIEQYLEAENISVEELAKRCGFSKGYISMLKNGINPRSKKPIAPTLISLEKLSHGMGMSIDNLLIMLNESQKVSLASEDDSFFLSDIEKKIILEYRKADGVSREMVHRVLGITEKINETKMA